MTGLAETVKRLRELLPQASNTDRCVYYDDVEKCWNMSGDTEALTEADFELAAECNPKTMAELLDALERLEREANDTYTAPDGREFSTLCAFNNYTQTKEIERLATLASKLEFSLKAMGEALDAARAGMRTPGTVEVCPTCKRVWATMHPDDKARCPGVNPFGISPCPVRAAQHPTPSQGTTPEKAFDRMRAENGWRSGSDIEGTPEKKGE